jgi:phospholipid transport system substrate-binding protein
MKRVGSLARMLFGLALWHVPAAALPAEGPRAVVQEAADQVVSVLGNKSLAVEQKHRKVEDIIDAHFDFDTLARSALARHWDELTPQQQREFVEELKKHVSMTYGSRVESYGGERVNVTGERAEARGDWTVTTKIVWPNDAGELLVDYRLHRENARWQVIDVITDGASLVSNFPPQFEEIVTRGGAERLLRWLREKNAKGEPLESGSRTQDQCCSGSGLLIF